MENNNNRFLAVNYRLFIDEEDKRHLVEQTSQERPFRFITGFGIALDAFEAQLLTLEKGAKFDFSLTKEQAYGEYDDDMVLSLERAMFEVDGRFDHEHVYQGAVIPMQNEEGHRFPGRVLEVTPDTVKVDLNHPLAGETLHFEGEIIENRPATEEEIQQLIRQLSGGCGGGCSGCGGSCGDDGDDGCGGCGNCGGN